MARNQSGATEKVQYGRSVDVNVIKAIQDVQRLLELVDLVAGFQTRLERLKFRMGGENEKVFEGGLMNAIRQYSDLVFSKETHAQGVFEELCDSRFRIWDLVAQEIVGGIPLNIEVNDQRLSAL